MLMAVLTIGRAQDRATLTFPDDGEREVWVQAAPAGAPASDSIRTGQSIVELNLAGKKPTDLVVVWDHKTGNLASTTVSDVKTKGNWSVPADAYKDIAQVKVRAEHSGQALAAGEITLDDSR